MSFLAECNIPSVVTGILSQLYRILIVLIPIGIVIFGSIDFIKATVAKDENAIATSSKTFISRLITGCITFFVLTIVNWLFTVIIGSVGGANSAMACALQILNGTATETSTNNNTSNNNINGGYNGTRDCYYSNKSICLGENYQSLNKEQECTDFANEQCQTNYYTTTTKIENKIVFETKEQCYDNCYSQKNLTAQTACITDCNNRFNQINVDEYDTLNLCINLISEEAYEEHADEWSKYYNEVTGENKLQSKCIIYTNDLISSGEYQFDSYYECRSDCQYHLKSDTDYMDSYIDESCKWICTGYCTNGSREPNELNKDRCKKIK